MKVVILAGGFGSRLQEETVVRPKPMVEIGGRPILWHIMKHYAHHGFNEFLIALGYKGEMIKRYFMDYYALGGSMTVRLSDGRVDVHNQGGEDWVVHLIDTGLDTSTGGRVKRLAPWFPGQTLMLTYGDGVCDVDLVKLLQFHRSHGRLATIVAVRPPARFGGVIFRGDVVEQFTEKPQIGEGWINGGYMILEPQVLDYIGDDRTSLEQDVLERLAGEGRLVAYRHEGFWQCMDTQRDLRLLEGLWQSGGPPWKIWT
ncbi:MAG: glucose-1-phosphate cytidylyltransferase [Armatimonadota bacterium]